MCSEGSSLIFCSFLFLCLAFKLPIPANFERKKPSISWQILSPSFAPNLLLLQGAFQLWKTTGDLSPGRGPCKTVKPSTKWDHGIKFSFSLPTAPIRSLQGKRKPHCPGPAQPEQAGCFILGDTAALKKPLRVQYFREKPLTKALPLG